MAWDQEAADKAVQEFLAEMRKFAEADPTVAAALKLVANSIESRKNICGYKQPAKAFVQAFK